MEHSVSYLAISECCGYCSYANYNWAAEVYYQPIKRLDAQTNHYHSSNDATNTYHNKRESITPMKCQKLAEFYILTFVLIFQKIWMIFVQNQTSFNQYTRSNRKNENQKTKKTNKLCEIIIYWSEYCNFIALHCCFFDNNNNEINNSDQ